MSSSADEMNRLLRIARRKSDASRRQLVAICSDLLRGGGSVLTNVEHALMRDILARLVEELSGPLRRALADHIAVISPQHAEAASGLAAEPVDLAAPLLLGVETAIDIELVETIRDRALEHRLMLAMRRSQSDLAEGEDAVDALLHFPDPAIPELAMAYLVEQSRRFDPFLEPVVRPDELSPGLRHKLTRWLLAGLRHHLQQHLRIESTRLDDAVDAVVGSMDVGSAGLGAARGRDAAAVLAQALGGCGAITATLMLQVLRQGEVALFVALMAETGGLRQQLVRRLLFEPGGDGLAMFCRATDLGRSVLAAIFLLTRRARPTDRATGPGELSQVLALYDGIQPAPARDVVARWRRDRDFLTALRFIEDVAGGVGGEDWTDMPMPALAADGATPTQGWRG